MKQLIHIYIMTGLLLLAGCNSAFTNNASEPTALPEDDMSIPTLVPDLPIVFPRQQMVEGEWIRMTGGLFSGRLIEVNRCLRLALDDGNDSHLIIWPPHYNIMVVNGEIQILDNTGQVIAVVGERVHMGGGIGSHLTYISIPRQLAEEIPDDCNGPYLISGGIVSRLVD